MFKRLSASVGAHLMLTLMLVRAEMSKRSWLDASAVFCNKILLTADTISLESRCTRIAESSTLQQSTS